jgi:protein-S-isoprenylcysteine O-methyltransferase Ste14
MTDTAVEHGAAVRFPFPPLLFAAPLAATLAVNRWVHPLPLPASSVVTVAGGVLTAAGVALGMSGVATVIRHHSTVVPDRPVANLVVAGPYRITRNPMYLGLTTAYLGVALWAGSWWPLFALPLSVLATTKLVIRPEEEYLGRRFGAAYERYRAKVRRWL